MGGAQRKVSASLHQRKLAKVVWASDQDNFFMPPRGNILEMSY